MSERPGTISVKLDSEEGDLIRKALAADQRANLLSLLAKRAMNINEIAAALGVSQPTASVHIRVLEEAGLVECEYTSTGKGSEKRCWSRFEKVAFELETGPELTEENVLETSMPIGLFTSVYVQETCGLASDSRIIGFLDNPQSFLMPERAEAQILWFAGGWIEYTFPCDLPSTADIKSVEFVAEICAEAPNYDNEWPSDITVWINDIEVGTWTAPGDFGGRRGRLNPGWWSDSLTQFGALKSWSINDTGCFIDGTMSRDSRIDDLHITRQRPITVRIGNKADAVHMGGVNLFGKHFGNYPQDLILRVRYDLKAPGQMAANNSDLLDRKDHA